MIQAVEELSGVVGVSAACDALGVPKSSFYDQKKRAEQTPKPRPKPPRSLTEEERNEVRDTLNSERFCDQSPYEVWATLMDEGVYLCSIRTMYRVLEENDEVKERRRGHQQRNYKKPELLATGPNQVWSWDITKLKGPEKWSYFYLYVIIDIYSRYVVGWMVATKESSELASQLIKESCERQGIEEGQLTLHSDRGSSMKSKTVAHLLLDLGVIKSHSRPHVSDDNPFSEAQFKTVKYAPSFPERFGCLEDSRGFCRRFIGWYNDEHHHTGIKLLTPAELHYGKGEEVLLERQKVLDAAYEAHPERFVKGEPKAGEVPEAVWINPPKKGQEQNED